MLYPTLANTMLTPAEAEKFKLIMGDFLDDSINEIQLTEGTANEYPDKTAHEYIQENFGYFADLYVGV